MVSVVMAAYKRPRIMACAIRSVLHQSLANWELIVVGDHCQDATEETVRAVNDPRIWFHNLPANTGDQAGPNNYGCDRARGEFIAFLNQDDLWLPHHLETAVEALRRTAAGLVFTLSLQSYSAETRWIAAAPPSGTYEPHGFYPASTWVFTPALWRTVGPWRRHTECLAAPSQNWLFRAYRQRARLLNVPWPDVVTPFSGSRRNSYLDESSTEHEELLHRIQHDPSFMRLEAIASAAARNPIAHGPASGPVEPDPWWIRAIARGLGTAGIHSHAVSNLLRFGGRGGFVRSLRRQRGLDSPRR